MGTYSTETKFDKGDLQDIIDIDNNWNSVTGGLVTTCALRFATGVAAKIGRAIPLVAAVCDINLAIQVLVAADANLIAKKINFMTENDYDYFVITTTYDDTPVYMPGSSNLTIKVVSQYYSYR